MIENPIYGSLDGGGGDSFTIPCLVSVDAGATVIATNGGDTITAISGEDGTVTLALNKSGTWTIYATMGEEASLPKTVYVPELLETTLFISVVLTWVSSSYTLSVARYQLMAANAGKYLVFAGGYVSAASKVVDAFDEDLVRTVPATMPAAKRRAPGQTVGNYALFAGGYSTYTTSTVYAYDENLTVSTATSFSAHMYANGAAFNKHAVYAGGYYSTSSSNGYRTTAYKYDETLTQASIAALGTGRVSAVCCANDQYLLVCSGYNKTSSYIKTTDVYNTDFTRTTVTASSVVHYMGAGAAIDKYLLAAGGRTASSAYTNVVDVYDDNLTLSQTAAGLTAATHDNSGCTFGALAVFIGGENSAVTTQVDTFDASLVRSAPATVVAGRASGAIGVVGHYLLYGGGENAAGTKVATVDAYTL